VSTVLVTLVMHVPCSGNRINLLTVYPVCRIVLLLSAMRRRGIDPHSMGHANPLAGSL
jgi:hypothetical protein